MKTTKKGNLKLDKGEVQVGNFIVKDEPEHIKITDINGMVSHRIGKAIAKGTLLSIMLDDYRKGEKQNLENYIASMFNVLSVIPDNDFYVEILNSYKACVERHKDLYGIKDDITEEEDREILDQVRGVREEIEKLEEEK